jgi:hypothetical protein
MADRERRPAEYQWGAVKSCNLLEEDDILARQGKVNISYTNIFNSKASFFIKVRNICPAGEPDD